MRRTKPARRARIVTDLRAAIAAAFAFTILLEPVLDVRCHAQAPSGSQRLSRADATNAGGDDPCASTCVPDCYCCSTPVVTTAGFDPPSTPVAAVPEALSARPLDGVTSVPDPPPIA